MKKKIALFVAAAITVLIILLLFSSPKATVVSATIPGTTVESGDSAIIYRFVVSAERADVKIEHIYFNLTFSQSASLTNLRLYDDNGNQLPGALYYSSEGMRYWPNWPSEERITIPKGTSKIFNLRGNVTGQGAVSIRIEDMTLVKGSVEGLPSATITIIIKH